MTEQERAEKVVQHMMENDAFSQWLGINIESVKPGYCKLGLSIREEMTNGFKVSHGGIVFSLADSALAFASNSYGRIALAIENNITYTAEISQGDSLTAETEELNNGNRIATYAVRITNQNEVQVAAFRGTIFRTQNHHFKPEY